MAHITHKSSEERREQISQAFLHVLAEHGYAKASINKTAEQAGLSPGLIHYHFKNKQAILLDVLARLLSRQMAHLDELLKPAQSAQDALNTLIDAFLAVGQSANPDAVAVWVTLSAEAIRQPEVSEAFQRAIDAIGDKIRAIIDRGVEHGEFSPGDDPADATGAIIALVQGYFSLAATHRDAIPAGSAAACARRMCAGLLRG